MAKNLRAAQATPTAISQTTNGGGKITSYNITIAVRYIDDAANNVTTINETIDAWPLLPQVRKDQLQAIQDMIVAGIAAQYL